jgi:hypothetical protein
MSRKGSRVRRPMGMLAPRWPRRALQSVADVRGYMVLFDSEKFHPSSEKTLFVGPEELEAEWEAEQGPVGQR